jgi:hypothetical protein
VSDFPCDDCENPDAVPMTVAFTAADGALVRRQLCPACVPDQPLGYEQWWTLAVTRRLGLGRPWRIEKAAKGLVDGMEANGSNPWWADALLEALADEPAPIR